MLWCACMERGAFFVFLVGWLIGERLHTNSFPKIETNLHMNLLLFSGSGKKRGMKNFLCNIIGKQSRPEKDEEKIFIDTRITVLVRFCHLVDLSYFDCANFIAI